MFIQFFSQETKWDKELRIVHLCLKITTILCVQALEHTKNSLLKLLKNNNNNKKLGYTRPGVQALQDKKFQVFEFE